MSTVSPFVRSLVVSACVLACAPPAQAYSVLAHEANVDMAWDQAIKPILLERFPRTSPEALAEARAYAYGGSVIQDLGYYPFGNHFFTNLVHYVRSGDFVEALVRDARTLDELAFALGAMSHYAADTTGHPAAVNRSVPLMFPKLANKYGREVTYAMSPASHVIAEFSFDVVQAAAGSYAPDAYHRFIGFEVAKPLLERAFRETYHLELKDLFVDFSLAVGTYRRSISEIIPHITEVAWRDKRDEIVELLPAARRDTFVFRISRAEYEQAYGDKYRKPGLLARVVAVIYKIVPKVGPLRPLQFKAPPREAERLFADSLKATQTRYRSALASARAGRLELTNTDFDTGRRARHSEYSLADKTYAELLDRLADTKFAGVSDPLRADILRFYGPREELTSTDRHERKHLDRIREQLEELRSAR